MITSSIASTTDGFKPVIPASVSASIKDGVKLLLKLGDVDDEDSSSTAAALGECVVAIDPSTPAGDDVELGVGAEVLGFDVGKSLLEVFGELVGA